MKFKFSKDGHTKTCTGCGVVVDAASGHICADIHHDERRSTRGVEPLRATATAEAPSAAPEPVKKGNKS